MSNDRPSLLKRALAVLVLAVAAYVLFRMVLGVISTVFWIVAVVALVVAALWAVTTLRSAGRRIRGGSRGQVDAPAHEDPVEAQMRRIREQLRDQGRL